MEENIGLRITLIYILVILAVLTIALQHPL